MTPGWVAAAALGAVLVAVLTMLTLRLLRAQAGVADDLVALRTRVRTVEGTLREGGATGAAAPRPSSVLVLLEPDLLEHRRLAADIRAHRGVPVGVPARLRVADSDAGRELVADFPVDVEFEQRTHPLTPDIPSVLVLDRQGLVVSGGTAASVGEVRELVDRVGAAAR